MAVFWKGWRLRRIGLAARILRIWYVFLRHGTEIHDRVCNTVCASEGYDDSPSPAMSLAMIERDVATTIAHQRTCVERINQFEIREFIASARAVEGLRYTRRADTV